ncbi:unnamed protein product [Schistocephalus solidus]|uniref:Uncharacterized protein n=1 Tax=Schistocephalus solidus TaxID=70667 RepID=A0A183TE09_SCHSO|nr:unnamed protein product [Schistocephalus solidus]
MTDKDLFLTLPFRGEPASELLHRRLNAAIACPYPATKIRLAFSSTPLLRIEGKERLSFQTSSMCIYTFTCSCGAGYICRTTRHLSKRMREHHPAWLNQGMIKSISSAIVAHLVDSSHRVAVNHAFRIIYKVPTKHSEFLRQRKLATAEAVAIRLTNPTLCSQTAGSVAEDELSMHAHTCHATLQRRCRNPANGLTPPYPPPFPLSLPLSLPYDRTKL